MKKILLLIIFTLIILLGCTKKKSTSELPPLSLIGSCEKKIHLFEKKFDWVIEKERAYIHFEYEDEYPSKKAFYYLEKQMLQCGWKRYEGNIEFLKGSDDWVNYLKDRPDNKTELVHHFVKYYTDKSKKRLASILLIYFSQSDNIEELKKLCDPNNNKQHVTVQIVRFNEKELKKRMDQHSKSEKRKKRKNNVKI